MVQQIRAHDLGTKEKVCIFKVPKITGNESSLFDFIDEEEGCQPPLVTSIPLQDLKKQAIEGTITWQFPCHIQNVERMVRSVTEAAARVPGFNRRDGFVRAQLKSRKEMSAFH